jgi:hypothetical protein
MGELVFEAMTDDDGEPWGVYVYGHHDLAQFAEPVFRARLVAELERAGVDDAEGWLGDRQAEHLWMHQDPEGDEESNWYYCGADAPGAIAITGIKFS